MFAQNNRQTRDSSNRILQGKDPVLLNAQRECRRLAKSHYENFLVGSVLLPRSMRQPFYNVYAFCRTADDLADESPSPEIALQRLDQFQKELDATFAGEPPQNLFTALADTIQQYDLTKQPFDDLLIAFRQDQSKSSYDNFDQLRDYCCRSANPVGRIVLQLGHSLSDETAALSDQICTGLQLANFWQDVARDRAKGRVYLPADQMARFGVTPQMLDRSTTADPLRQLLSQECDRAELFFRRGLPLADHVPKWLASDVKLFAQGGLATLAAIRKIDFDVLRVRPTISKLKQMGLVWRALRGKL